MSGFSSEEFFRPFNLELFITESNQFDTVLCRFVPNNMLFRIQAPVSWIKLLPCLNFFHF